MGILAIKAKTNSTNILEYFKKKGKVSAFSGILTGDISDTYYFTRSDTNDVYCNTKKEILKIYIQHKIKFLNDIPKNNYELWD